MHFRNLLFASLFLLVAFCIVPSRAEVDVSVGLNFSELNDYGEWVHVHGLGRVWHPDAEPGWRPFMYGHWVYSDDGWLWDSDEPFGWMVCHYGSWYNDEEQGWVWIPGNEWSPARVEWYVTDDEIGWAPMFPPGHHQRFAREHWMFSPTSMFASVDVRNHVELRLRPTHEARVHVYVGAPRIEFVQRHVESPVVRVRPNKVQVSVGGGHSMFKVEFGNRPQADVVIPVRSKTVRARVEPERRHEVIVEPRESRHEVREAEPEHRVRVEVEPRENRTQVEVKSRRGDDRDNNRDDDNDNGRDRNRAKIEVHVR